MQQNYQAKRFQQNQYVYLFFKLAHVSLYFLLRFQGMCCFFKTHLLSEVVNTYSETCLFY
jgi:hypothetical protein